MRACPCQQVFWLLELCLLQHLGAGVWPSPGFGGAEVWCVFAYLAVLAQALPPVLGLACPLSMCLCLSCCLESCCSLFLLFPDLAGDLCLHT